MLARRGIATVDGTDLLPSLNRRFEVAKLRLAKPRHVEQLLLARLGGRIVRARRLHQHVAQLGVLTLLSQVVLYPRQRFRVRGVEAGHASPHERCCACCDELRSVEVSPPTA